MAGDSVAQDMLQGFIRRILNTLEEIDEMQADKKAIYKEVFDAGLDRTIVAQVVGHLRKEAKDKTKFEHQSAMFDLYLSAYIGVGTVPATHAARKTVEHDANGVFHETPEQQPPPAARDLTSDLIPQGDSGQVATHTPEMANDIPDEPTNGGPYEYDHASEPVKNLDRRPQMAAPDVGQTDHEHQRVGQLETNTAPAGRAADESPATIYSAPGEIIMEHTPPKGFVAHPFATCWPVQTVDPDGGIREPIVRIENLILDGRGRYLAARAVNGGQGLDYPVVQYAGDDELVDSITWNLASRPNMDPRALRIVAEKLAKLVPDRAEEIMERFGFTEAQEAAQ